MGQNLSNLNLSCVDCGSHLITQEDNESCIRIKSRDKKSVDLVDELDDEITVFESPEKFPRIHPIFQSPSLPSPYQSPNSITHSYSQVRLRVKTSKTKLHEDGQYSEISTPSLATNCSFSNTRYKTFSSNFSPISMNLVETIRKTQNFACKSEVTYENLDTFKG